MTIITKVKFHKQFLEGQFDKATATDLALMSDAEVERMLAWLTNIVAGNSHPGKNMPSGFSKGAPVPGAEMYRDNNIWHYHCGPYLKQDGDPKQWTDNTLSANSEGKQSAQVYHYSKQADTVIVLGYSRIHNPFPLASSKKNPIGPRADAMQDTVDVDGV